MAGRKSHHERSDGGSREQARKPRGNARGHGAYHKFRSGKEAPRSFGTGRDRTEEIRRPQGFIRLHDEALEELGNIEKRATAERWVDELEEAHTYGAVLKGTKARGTVYEVRRGNFLTRMGAPSEAVAADSTAGARWKSGALMRTFARGILQQFDMGLSSLVAPGDDVELIVPPLEGEHDLVQHALHAILTKVLPRRSELRRLHPSGRSIQTIAANVDRVCIVSSAAEPEFRPGFVDRVLVCAAACNVPATLVFNKTDLGIEPDDEELLAVYGKLGVEVFRISVADVDAPQGDFEALKERLAGSRTVLTGHSGVGKSSLLLALDKTLDSDVVPVCEVSTSTNKGVHTTTHARMFTIDLGGRSAEVIDTPGVREFMPADTDRRNLWGWFPEIAALQGKCGFANCTHINEKDCAVLAAAERGEIHPRRYQSYVHIHQTLPV